MPSKNKTEESDLKIMQLGVETGFKKWLSAIVVIFLLFVVPIQAVNLLNAPKLNQTLTGQGVAVGRIAGVSTDNSGRYVQIPLINFAFDTTLREPATLSVAFGGILFILALVIVIFGFADFNKREQKYS